MQKAWLAEFLVCNSCNTEFGPFPEDESAGDLFWARPTSKITLAKLIQKRIHSAAQAEKGAA
jgi:hypothetical protein